MGWKVLQIRHSVDVQREGCLGGGGDGGLVRGTFLVVYGLVGRGRRVEFRWVDGLVEAWWRL